MIAAQLRTAVPAAGRRTGGSWLVSERLRQCSRATSRNLASRDVRTEASKVRWLLRETCLPAYSFLTGMLCLTSSCKR
jgi:hypothetical protein